MNMLIKRNQIVITALAALVAVAGYINYGGKDNEDKLVAMEVETTTGNETATKDVDAEIGGTDDEKESVTDVSAEEASKVLSELNQDKGDVNSQDADISGEPGEAILVNATGTYDYIVEAKLEKEYLRASMMESLLEIVNNADLSAEEKKSAVDKYAQLSTNAEKELLAESSIKARGYENAVVTVIDEKADVIILSKPLEITEVTRIQEIVKSKTGVKSENITITVVDTSK